MFALLSVLNHLIYKVPVREGRCSVSPFVIMRFKMRLGYEAWRQRISVAKMFKNAVHLTLH